VPLGGGELTLYRAIREAVPLVDAAIGKLVRLAGGVKVTVQVSPRRPSLKSAKAAKGRKLTVKWVKDRMAAGYQVQVSTSKAFKKDVKSKKLAKASHTFTKLKAGKKYYVRVRSYKGALRSAWSKVRQSGKIKR
jgi:hypothetical protein